MTQSYRVNDAKQPDRPDEQGNCRVAQVLQQIETEYQAGTSGLSGYAQVAPHRHRTQQTEHIKIHLDELISLVGEEEAICLAA